MTGNLIQTLVSGLALGAVYALMALGLTIVYRSTTVVNFMHGQSFMLGGIMALVGVTQWNLPYVLVLPGALIVAFALGFGFSKAIFEPLLKGPHLTHVFATFAFVFILTGAVRYFTVDQRGLPPIAGREVINVGGAALRAQDLAMIAVLLIIAGGFAWVFQRTHLGRLLKAITQNPRGCELVGIDVRRLYAVMWGVGGALGALAGILASPIVLVSPDMGTRPLLLGFAAMTLGGFGSFAGAIVGGLLVGVAETTSGFYISTNLGSVAGFILIFVVLLVRPRGLFGTPEVIR